MPNDRFSWVFIQLLSVLGKNFGASWTCTVKEIKAVASSNNLQQDVINDINRKLLQDLNSELQKMDITIIVLTHA